ncbi:MAG: hypothetical protein GY757_19595 [bacterium]|nr:hypothetical protein [bacterium]
MRIANPIYDVVFKYLMEDNDIARLIISTIIRQNVVSLEFRPQEGTVELQSGSLTVYRLDFSAKIETPYGPKTVLIELQKAKFATDVIRFRKYLGEQYKSDENIYKKKIIRKHLGKKVEIEENKAIPILSIYFLGYPLEHFQVPVIRVQRECYNDATDEKLVGSEEFIEGLTHDSYIIQVPYLKGNLQSELEKMLSIFDQSKRLSNHHILDIKEEDYPEKYRPIIRRLQHAGAEQVVRDQMDIEDEITDELNNMSRVIQQQKEILIEAEIAMEQKDKVLEQNKTAMKEKDKALEEKDKLIRKLLKQKDNS